MKKYTTYKIPYSVRSIISVSVWLMLMFLWGLVIYNVLGSDTNQTPDESQGVAEGLAIGTILFGIMFAIAGMWVSDKIDTLYQHIKDKRYGNS